MHGGVSDLLSPQRMRLVSLRPVPVCQQNLPVLFFLLHGLSFLLGLHFLRQGKLPRQPGQLMPGLPYGLFLLPQLKNMPNLPIRLHHDRLSLHSQPPSSAFFYSVVGHSSYCHWLPHPHSCYRYIHLYLVIIVRMCCTKK